MKIESISALEVLDSRGNPTVQATVVVEGDAIGSAMVPSGASTGTHEARELRDNDGERYKGQGVQQAVRHVDTEIQAALLGKDAADQPTIDKRLLELDGTKNKSRLGANAILAVSLAVARAEAAAEHLPLFLYLQQLFPKRQVVLPLPQMNVINGGKHASNKLSIQEFHIVPVGAEVFSDALRMGAEVYQALKKILQRNDIQVEVGDEGGFAPKASGSDEIFSLLMRAIEEAGYTPGIDVCLGIDAAATEFFDEDTGHYRLDGKVLVASDLADVYEVWRQRYPLISIEDPFTEDGWSDWTAFTEQEGGNVQVIGDDLFVTNPERIRRGILEDAATSVLIKPNQIGTLSETLEAIRMTQEAGMAPVISHRSGETEDTFIADLAVAVGAGQIKTGAPARSERTAKYNRLLAIEQEIGGKMGDVLAKPAARIREAYQELQGLKVTNSRRLG